MPNQLVTEDVHHPRRIAGGAGCQQICSTDEDVMTCGRERKGKGGEGIPTGVELVGAREVASGSSFLAGEKASTCSTHS
jgi:hypothetical protein